MRRWWSFALGAVVITALLFGVALLRTRPERVERVTLLMDTPVRVVVYGDAAVAAAAADAVISEVARLEDLWHPKKPESDVTRVNAAAGREPVKVAPETLALTREALAVAEASGGAFDPTVGPLVNAWGFGAEHRIPSEAERAAALALVDWRAVKIDAVAGTLYLERPGMILDLGAIAKGHAAEVGRALLRRYGVEAGLVQLGGAVSTLGKRPEGGKWQIAVQHPRKPESFLTVLQLDEALVDTSGDYQRFFMQDGTRYHHVMDPATGAPARGVAAVTVVTAVTAGGGQADALSTAALVLGMEKGLAFLQERGVEAIMVSTAGEVQVTPGLAGKIKVEAGGPWQ